MITCASLFLVLGNMGAMNQIQFNKEEYREYEFPINLPGGSLSTRTIALGDFGEFHKIRIYLLRYELINTPF